jgi:hypothetical protein
VKRSKHPPPIGLVTLIHNGKFYFGRWRRGVVRHYRSHRPIHTDVERSDEGITWIRGHHEWNSEEGRALRAAYVLREPKHRPEIPDTNYAEYFREGDLRE